MSAKEKSSLPHFYQPLRSEDDTDPRFSQQVMFVPAQPMVGQPTVVAYSANGQLPLGPIQPVVMFPSMGNQACNAYTVRPQNIVPSSHLALTVVLFVILMIFAPETFMFMVPALILSVMSHSEVGSGNYARGKKLGNGALALNFAGLIFAFVVAIVCVSLSISLYPWRRASDYYDYAYGGCYYDYDYDGSGFADYPLICY